MSKRRKVNNLASQQFYKFEKWILAEKSLKKLSPTAKLLYMVLCDREQLSLKNYKDFTDKEGCLFQYFDQEKASELLGVSLTAIKKAFKDLQEFKLIESVRQGLGKPNRLYILEFEVTEDTLKELSYENKKASTVPPVKADKENIKTNNSIPQNNKKYASKKEENKNKVLNNKHNNTVKNTFTEYGADELEKKLQKSQEDRLGYSQFNPSFKLK
ncbi:MAG: replication initiator protein A [Terrisporobacter sp.]|uniref:replication initiator protein A n=1 Tax=Terrisporobacter sp. TaxID=1965305 RepID=UPI002A91EDFF|nr:replication initiator protein A [Terrisporobacter sp.]MDY6153775.1 replication initiator protein A [Terrisporobacter sp.]